MPIASPRPCTYPGCGALVRDGGARCAAHRNVEKREYDRRRPTSAQRGYGFRWQRARAQFLIENPLCVSCGQPANIVDHIIPPKGNSELFWSVSNWQAMCPRCHNRKTARQDGAFGNPRRGRGGENL